LQLQRIPQRAATSATAEHFPAREDCAARIGGLARPGDRVVIAGARGDTLALFARDLLAALA